MKYKFLLDASDWKVFGFDAFVNKDFYAKLANAEVISGAFHEKYDKTIASAATIKRRDNAEDYINKQFNTFFNQPEVVNIKWTDMLVKNIKQSISIHYVTRYLKPWFCKNLNFIEDVKLENLVIGEYGLGLFELKFITNKPIDRDTLEDQLEAVVGSLESLVTDGIVVDEEKFTRVCGNIREILVNEMVKNLNPSFTKFVKGFLKG